jgi:transposase-like protein
MKTTSQPRRRRRSATEWASLVEKSKTSSLPLSAFCERANVSLSQLYNWRKKLRAGTTAAVGGFTPVRLRATAQPVPVVPAGSIEVQLQNGRVVRVIGTVDARVLNEVILTAEGGVSC